MASGFSTVVKSKKLVSDIYQVLKETECDFVTSSVLINRNRHAQLWKKSGCQVSISHQPFLENSLKVNVLKQDMNQNKISGMKMLG